MTTVVTVYEPTTEVTVNETAVTANITEQTTAVTISSGVRTLANLSDVALSSPADTQVLTYDTASGKWINAAASGVSDAADVTFTPAGNIEAINVQAAIEELDTEKSGTAHNHSGTYDPAGSAAAVQSNLDDHEGDNANPHNVTALQVGALANIVEDTTPQLGGNLDLNSFVITGLEIGTDVQAQSDNLDDIAGLAPGAGEDGYSITWDNGAGAFVLTEVTGGGGGAWGTITGTLSDQTDLNTALNARVADTGDTMTGALAIDTSINGNILSVNGASGGAGGTASPVILRIRDKTVGSSWDTVNPFAALDFYSDDTSGPSGAKTRARIATRQVSPVGGSSTMEFFVDVSGTLTKILTFDSTQSAMELPQGKILGPTSGDFIFHCRGNGPRGDGFPEGWHLVAGGVLDTNEIITATFNNRVGIQNRDPQYLFHAIQSDAVTNAVTTIAALGHNSSGTPAAGFGGGLRFQLETTTTENQDAARVVASWNTATHASRKADLTLSVFDTAEREGLRIRGDGSAPAIGFLGATPVARAAHIADPSGGVVTDAEARTAINAILVVLENLGFVATS